MRATLVNFLSLKALNVIGSIYAILVFIYASLVVANLWSIWGGGASRMWARIAWSLFVICVPVVGMFCYGIWCLSRSDLGSLRQMGILKNK